MYFLLFQCNYIKNYPISPKSYLLLLNTQNSEPGSLPEEIEQITFTSPAASLIQSKHNE